MPRLLPRYGLGLAVTSTNGRRVLEHGGEVSRFTAENILLPDDGFALAVLTNQDAAGAASQILRGALNRFLKSQNLQDPKQDALVRKILDGLKQGTIDRSLFTENANAYFTEQALKDYASSLAALGEPQSLTQSSVFARRHVAPQLTSQICPESPGHQHLRNADGKFEQWLIAIQE